MNRLGTKLLASAAAASTVNLTGAISCYAEAGSETGLSPKGGVPEFYSGVSGTDTFMMIVQVIFFLIVIIGLFLLIIKFLSQKNKFFSLGRSFRSLGGVPLGTNKSIQVIQLGNSLYIVGVGENIQLLDKIDQLDEVEEIRDLLSSSAKTGQTFDSFANLLKKMRKTPPDEDLDTGLSFQQVFLDKMQNVKNRKEMVEHILMDEQKTDRLNDK